MITISISLPIGILDIYQYCQKLPITTPLVIEYNIVRSALPLPNKEYQNRPALLVYSFTFTLTLETHSQHLTIIIGLPILTTW